MFPKILGTQIINYDSWANYEILSIWNFYKTIFKEKIVSFVIRCIILCLMIVSPIINVSVNLLGWKKKI